MNESNFPITKEEAEILMEALDDAAEKAFSKGEKMKELADRLETFINHNF